MSPDATILLVRHGQSTWNAEGRWQGQADPPLSELGRTQAKLASQRIGSIDVLVASPQRRALETAVIIGTSIGVGPVTTVDDLRERNAGPWSGLTRAEIDERYPGFLDGDKRPHGYEGDSSLLSRTLESLHLVAERHPSSTVLVATHGGVIHNLEAHLGLDIGRVPNLSGRVVTRHGSEWRAGEQVSLLDEELTTGGDPRRV